jgi:hypothetical protein
VFHSPALNEEIVLGDNQLFLEQSTQPIALLLTDPPWGAGTQNRGTAYEFKDDPQQRDDLIQRVSVYAGRCARTCFIACDSRWEPYWHIALREQGFETENLVCESQLGNPGKSRWPVKHYYWVYGTTEKSIFDATYLPLEERRARLGVGEHKQVAGVLRTTMSNTDPERVEGWQAQKPVWLLEAMIRTCTQPGELVVDPFLGSGSTAIACMRTQRKIQGIEQNPASYAYILQRIQREKTNGIPLFLL